MDYLMTKEEIRKKYKTDLTRGLKQGEAEARIETFGKNILSNQKKQNIIIRFIKQFNDFMILILYC